MTNFSPPFWFIKNKKLLDAPCWYYNPFLKQHLCNCDGPMYFYDKYFDFIFKEPKLRHAEDVQFIDADLCVFNIPYLNKVILYSMTKREIVFSIILRLPKNMGEIFGISSVWFFKKENTLVFKAVWRETKGSMDCYSAHKLFAYDISVKKYVELFENFYSTTTFIFNNQYISIDQTDNKHSLMILNNDLTYKIINTNDLFEKLINYNYAYVFDSNQGVVAFYGINDSFDGYTYYGNNYSKEAIDLTGKLVPWEPLNKVVNPQENVKKIFVEEYSEEYIRKNGVDIYALSNFSDEEIIHGGYFWALDRIEEKAKAAEIELQDFIGNEQISEIENVLYSIGWFETEMGEGGVAQYFGNGDTKELEFLIQALNLIGATETVKLIPKGAKIKVDFEKKGNFTDNDYEKQAEELESLEEQFAEDYVALAVEYLKKQK